MHAPQSAKVQAKAIDLSTKISVIADSLDMRSKVDLNPDNQRILFGTYLLLKDIEKDALKIASYLDRLGI